MNLFEEGLDGKQQELRGSLRKVWFRGEDGFGVGQFRLEASQAAAQENITVRGRISELVEGQPAKIVGVFEEHPRYGRQFRITQIEVERPEGISAVKAYLGSGIVKGIGPALAKRIVAAFGEETLQVIEEEPERLEGVSGIGAKKATEIHEAISSQMSLREVLLFLHGHGLPAGLAQRILDSYGEDAPRLLKNNPYRLADELVGVGFKRADEVAAKLGIAPDCEERRQAALLYCLGRAVTREGHSALPRSRLLADASKLLNQAAQSLEPALQALAETRRVVIEVPPGLALLREIALGEESELVYPLRTWSSETGLERALVELARCEPIPLLASTEGSQRNENRVNDALVQDIEAALRDYERKQRIELPSGQRAAIRIALSSSVSVVTGGPGVGKTTIIRALCELVESGQHVVALAAPTGRAAKRLSEATGRPATTLHRLLEFNAGSKRFARNERRPIEAELVVVDEASMLDLALAYEVTRAIQRGTHLVFVGDVDQLPSVGPGRVLEDLIASGLVPVARLDKIFRQREGSEIVENAHRIRAGRLPTTRQQTGSGRSSPESELGDFFFVESRDPGKSLEAILEIVGTRIPKRFALDPVEDVQVLSPMYRGPLGVDSINQALGSLLEPEGPALRRGSRRFRRGSKVLQLRNDYELDLYNGDPGRVSCVDVEAGKIRVNFSGREVELSGPEIDQIVPAWAITVHRAQGSEYPAVVLALDAGHYLLLHRRLLYTAVTRAKRLLVLVGSRWALERAIGNDEDGQRISGLGARLRAQVLGDGVHPELCQRPAQDDG